MSRYILLAEKEFVALEKWVDKVVSYMLACKKALATDDEEDHKAVLMFARAHLLGTVSAFQALEDESSLTIEQAVLKFVQKNAVLKFVQKNVAPADQSDDEQLPLPLEEKPSQG